jgi:TolB protein
MRQRATAGAVGVAVAALALVLAGCSSRSVGGPQTAAAPGSTGTVVRASATTTTPALATAGTESPGSSIPWAQVGPGWMVALWGPHAAVAAGSGSAGWERQTTTVYLVDPVGGRYRVTTLPAPSDYSLVDWSGDGRRVLLLEPGGSGGSTFDDLDLTTGRVLHSVTQSENASARFTRPTGQALLVWTAGVDQAPTTLVRTSWSGATQLSYPDSYPGLGTLSTSVLSGLDGTQLVVGTTSGMALVANDGTFVRAIGPPGRNCTPTRWWDTDDLIASCQPPSSSGASGPSLWIVPVGGQAATQLTDPQAPDYGDVDAWQVGSATYVQALEGCGSEYLALRNPDGTTAKVAVPGATDSVQVIGAHQTQLALLAQLACGSGETLFWFDPATATDTPLLGPQVNGGGVLAALPYPGLQP